MTDAKALITERGKTHGNWEEQAAMTNAIKRTMRYTPQWDELEPHQVEALDMIATKLGRILTGVSTHYDHWDDMAGYALLGRGEPNT